MRMKNKNHKKPEKPFTIKVKPQGIVRINRGLVFTLVIIGILVFGWIIFTVFRIPHVKAKKSANNAIMHNAGAKDVTAANHDTNNILKQLPKNYTDIDTVKKYLIGSSSKNVTSPEVEQKLSDLKHHQAFLQQRVADLLQHQMLQKQSANMQRAKQAKSSGLFFAGVTPPRKQQITKPQKDKQQPQTITQKSPKCDKQSAYNQQNMQSQKLAFLQSSPKTEDVYDKHPLLKPVSPYEIQAGTIIPAELITAINTTLPGSVIAQIRQNIFDTVSGNFLLIPKGSKLIGEYQSMISYGQERVLIAFTRVIRPDGSSIQLDKYGGTDVRGQAGMKGNVDSHWFRVLGAATLSTLLSVGAGVAADNSYNTSTYYRGARQNAFLGASSSIAQTGQQLTQQAMNVQPTLTIPIGYEFNVIVKKDMIMEPYKYKPGNFYEK
jgi:type IV secretion system protein VirB10